MNDKNMIMVWRFEDAPEDLKNLSDNGGDEDWIAAVPNHILNEQYNYIGWLDSTSFDTCCEPQIIQYQSIIPGYTIYIGSHA